MSDNFKNYMEALNYCKKYDLGFLCLEKSSFIIAESLLRTYKDGTIQPAGAADAKNRCSCMIGSQFCEHYIGDGICGA